LIRTWLCNTVSKQATSQKCWRWWWWRRRWWWWCVR